jgi:hypothetical protein
MVTIVESALIGITWSVVPWHDDEIATILPSSMQFSIS